MRTIIAGSRHIYSSSWICECLNRHADSISLVLSGCCKGPDTIGAAWAAARRIPVMRMPADWKALGKAAGPVRNRQMAKHAEQLIAFWDGESRGTRDMIDRMVSKNDSTVIVYQPGREMVKIGPEPR